MPLFASLPPLAPGPRTSRPRAGSTRVWSLLPGAALVFACSTSAPTLPFDVRPAMGALRQDTEAIGRALSAGQLREASGPAARIAEVRLSVGYTEETDRAFISYEGALRDQARVLSLAIDANQPDQATAAFSGLLDRCDRCHERFRPGGAAGR